MAVRIRLTREGRKKRPFYRIGIFDRRTARGGRSIEVCGHYNPLETDDEKKIVVKQDRIEHWFAQGAIPSDSVVSLLRTKGINLTRPPKGARRKARAAAK